MARVQAGTRLFAYGTLREPGRLAALLGPGVRWHALGPATIDGQLYDAGRYPALRRDPGPRAAIAGELIEFDDPAVFGRLDAYEGVGDGLYRRCAAVVTHRGHPVTAWVYVYGRSVAGLRRIRAWP
jgi:gamma-glutamylcyclotransferase (GGCT)/AIG2-like uncharacterized protein YtfP